MACMVAKHGAKAEVDGNNMQFFVDISGSETVIVNITLQETCENFKNKFINTYDGNISKDGIIRPHGGEQLDDKRVMTD